MSKRYTNTESSQYYRPSIYNNPPSDYIPPPSNKQSWNGYPEYNNHSKNNYYNNGDGDITNAYNNNNNRPNGDIPMNTISIDNNGYPDDKTYSKYNSYNPNLHNSNYTYSTQNVGAYPNRYNSPRVPLADPQTPKKNSKENCINMDFSSIYIINNTSYSWLYYWPGYS